MSRRPSSLVDVDPAWPEDGWVEDEWLEPGRVEDDGMVEAWNIEDGIGSVRARATGSLSRASSPSA